MTRIRSFLAILTLAAISAACYSPPADAGDHLGWSRMLMRTTTAASAVALPVWGTGSPKPGYADSLVFRKAAVTRTLTDTSIAYPIEDYRLPPTFNWRGAQYGGRAQFQNNANPTTGAGVRDSVTVDTTDITPWLMVRVRQDSVATGPLAFTGTTGMDSILVGAQISVDGGANWIAVNGTPTRAFIAATILSGEDGIQVPAVTALEASPGADYAQVAFQCHPSIQKAGETYIINRTLCVAGGLVRWIINVTDGSGQFAVDIAQWKADK